MKKPKKKIWIKKKTAEKRFFYISGDTLRGDASLLLINS